MTLSLEGFLNESLDGSPRGYGSTFRKAVETLSRAGVPFALAGSLAYSFHVEPTYTRDADLLVDASAWKEARRALHAAGFQVDGDSTLMRATDSGTGVWIDLMFGVGDPEESARESAQMQTLFQTKTPVIHPNYILWMYLLSDQGRHRDRALEMLRRGAADVGWLARALKYDGDQDALHRLRALMIAAKSSPSKWKPRAKRARPKIHRPNPKTP